MLSWCCYLSTYPGYILILSIVLCGTNARSCTPVLYHLRICGWLQVPQEWLEDSVFSLTKKFIPSHSCTCASRRIQADSGVRHRVPILGMDTIREMAETLKCFRNHLCSLVLEWNTERLMNHNEAQSAI